jgi:hypothetical protein
VSASDEQSLGGSRARVNPCQSKAYFQEVAESRDPIAVRIGGLLWTKSCKRLQGDLLKLSLSGEVVGNLERGSALDPLRLLNDPWPLPHEIVRLVPELVIRATFVQKEDDQPRSPQGLPFQSLI